MIEKGTYTPEEIVAKVEEIRDTVDDSLLLTT